MEPEIHIILKRYANFYIWDLCPLFCQGRDYLVYMMLQYAESSFSTTPRQLFELAANEYHKTSNNIRKCVGNYIEKISLYSHDEIYLHRWAQLGWDFKTHLTPSSVTTMLCRGFSPYLERTCSPEELQQLQIEEG